jgi:hypothetical protein
MTDGSAGPDLIGSMDVPSSDFSPSASKISNALKGLGFQSHNLLAQLFMKLQEHVQSGFDDQV